MKLPKSYRVQDGCYNCKYVRNISHCDTPDHRCNFEKADPGKKHFGLLDSVGHYGICDKHEKEGD